MVDTHAQGIDPFKATSWYPAAVLTVLYMLFVKLGPKAMASRSAEFDVKPLMLIYNLYQV